MASVSVQHEALAAMVGEWEGTATTWTEPGRPPDVSPWQVTIAPMLGGLFFQQRHRGRFGNQPFEGVVIYGFDLSRGLHTAVWFDSFHTGSAQLVSEGPPPEPPALLDVRGRYFVKAAEEHWGWRTLVRMPSAGTLRLEAFNITPDGVEYPAIEVVLSLRAG